MYIDGKVFPLKTVRGRNTGKFVGRYRDVSTLEFPSKESASEALSLLIATRCDYRSTAELPDGTVDTWEYDEQGRECVFTRE